MLILGYVRIYMGGLVQSTKTCFRKRVDTATNTEASALDKPKLDGSTTQATRKPLMLITQKLKEEYC